MKMLWLILMLRARQVNKLRTLLITAILSSLVLSATVRRYCDWPDTGDSDRC